MFETERIAFAMRLTISALVCAPALTAFAAGTPASGTPNLIPDAPNTASPNYVCTWACQDWYAHNRHKGEGISPRDTLNHEQLFGEQGWAKTFYPGLRGDLIYLLDDGWDLPKAGFDTFGSLEVHPSKFPNYGDTPTERLKTLVRNVKAAGWKGCGVWICANEKKGEDDKGHNEPYWRQRLEWSRDAGIAYWKIDWGNHSGDEAWRKMITRLADEIYPALVIEHITGLGPTSDARDPSRSGRLTPDQVARNVRRGSFADVYRTYDVTSPLSMPTTFDRVATQLANGYTDGKELGLVNGEDEVHLCAAVGACFGVMRYPIGDEPAWSQPNIFFGGGEHAYTHSRPLRKMMDEVRHAVMWARIAPPFRVDASKTLLSDTILDDSWKFSQGDNWESWMNGTVLTQRATSAIARGTALPTVTQANSAEPLPYVSVCRFPNGATAVGTYGRTTPEGGYRPAKARIAALAGKPEAPVGVFGVYDTLTLTFEGDLAGKTLWAQSLMGTTPAKDITKSVKIEGKTLTLPGDLLKAIGKEGATEPYSEPALVLQFR